MKLTSCLIILLLSYSTLF